MTCVWKHELVSGDETSLNHPGTPGLFKSLHNILNKKSQDCKHARTAAALQKTLKDTRNAQGVGGGGLTECRFYAGIWYFQNYI